MKVHEPNFYNLFFHSKFHFALTLLFSSCFHPSSRKCAYNLGAPQPFAPHCPLLSRREHLEFLRRVQKWHVCRGPAQATKRQRRGLCFLHYVACLRPTAADSIFPWFISRGCSYEFFWADLINWLHKERAIHLRHNFQQAFEALQQNLLKYIGCKECAESIHRISEPSLLEPHYRVRRLLITDANAKWTKVQISLFALSDKFYIYA
jgi:hypothetical protein